MKRLSQLLITIFFLAIISGGSNVQGAQDVLFQRSLLNALDKGLAEGEMTIKDLKQHGDFGLGTFNAIDGELIGVDGNFYHMGVDGAAQPADDSMKTPYAFATFFEPDKRVSLE
ncbi:MAG: acetolactate decarboxylase, partial [Deltaproteobacteria bacterium]|nr:acetolactate decarboxylase [Deltaproteobacteria bacterium]